MITLKELRRLEATCGNPRYRESAYWLWRGTCRQDFNAGYYTGSGGAMPELLASYRRAIEVIQFYGKTLGYEPLETMGGTRPPGILAENGKKAREFLKEVEGE